MLEDILLPWMDLTTQPNNCKTNRGSVSRVLQLENDLTL
jgi:hypothetical protein